MQAIVASITNRMDFLHVAVAVVFNEKGEVLISQRHPESHQGGKWEFPGGKVEAGESVTEALIRELYEEVNIRPVHFCPLIKIKHRYPDKFVLLDVWRVSAYEGLAHGKEQQEISWCGLMQLDRQNFPDANKAIITALRLPPVCLITPDYDKGSSNYFTRLRLSLESGVRLVQLRDTKLMDNDYMDLASRVLELCKEFDAQLILNADPSVLSRIQAQGVHLNSHRLFQYQSRPVSYSVLLSTACHNESEIAQAESLDVDFAFISPVGQTPTHPEMAGLGWENFEKLVSLSNRPVYALGGMSKECLPKIQSMGGHGVAGITNFFLSD